MEEPTHVIMRCPHGHDLRVATTDIGKPLSCPVCNTVFQSGGGAASTPVTLGYAGGGGLGGPAEKPSYTTWLLVLWFLVECVAIVNGYTLKQDPAVVLGCVTVVLFVPAAILQLLWIHRLHTDAARSRGYRDITAGTALGLSFIPYFNYIWTAWTLKKLSEFAAKLEGKPVSLDTPVVRAGRFCFYFSILKIVVFAVAFVAGGIIGFRIAQEAGQQGFSPAFDPYANLGTGFWVVTSITNVISLGCLIGYIWAVRQIEPALYAALTTPQTPMPEEPGTSVPGRSDPPQLQ